MRLIENDFANVNPTLADAEILDTTVTWRNFCVEINKIVVSNSAGITSAEDKRLGAYFVHLRDLKFNEDMGDLKASYYDVVLNCKDLVAISVIAKDYGWTANHMNQYLHEKGIQFKQGKKIWLLYKEYAEMGLTSTKTHTYSASDVILMSKFLL